MSTRHCLTDTVLESLISAFDIDEFWDLIPSELNVIH